MYISVYNLFYTSLPVLALGVFEQDVSEKDSIEFPKLYTPGLTNELFNVKEFMRSVMHGLFSSLVTFIIPWGTYHDGGSYLRFRYDKLINLTLKNLFTKF